MFASNPLGFGGNQEAQGTAPSGGEASGNGIPGTEQPQGESQPAYATLDQVRALLDEVVDRKVQSIKDKRLSGVQQQVQEELSKLDERFNELRQVGINPPQAMVDQARQDVIKRAVLDQDGSRQASAPGSGNPIDQAAAEIYQEYGVQLFPDDPEAAAINAEMQAGTITPRKFLRMVEEATAAKAQRTGGQSAQQQIAGAPPAARIPGGMGTPLGGRADAITKELQVLQQNPAKNWTRIRQLSGELEKLLK